MNNQFLMNEDTLWDYVDGLLSDEDRHQVEAYILQNPEWQARLTALNQEKKALFAIPLERPDRGFSDRVIAAWTAEHTHQTALATPARHRDWILYAIAGTFGLSILAPTVLMVIAALQSAPLELPAVNMPALSGQDWHNLFNLPALQMGIVAVLALLLVLTIEKYLHQKKVLETLKY